MLQHQDPSEHTGAITRLGPEAQQAVIARAAQLQEQDREALTTDQIEAAAQELGIDPIYVRQAVAEVRDRLAAEALMESRRRIVAGWRRLGLLGLPSLLSLLAIPTGQPAWLALLGFSSFFLFALIPSLIYSAIPGDKLGYAPGWQLRCPKCGRTKDAGEAGIVRVGAAGTKRILGACSQCASHRWLFLERAPESVGSSADAAD